MTDESIETRDTNERYVDYLVKLAADNVAHGVIEEPRAYYDSFKLLANGLVSEGQRGVFLNGEQFPVRITHASMFARPQGAFATDERSIQKMGVRFTFHDQYYQARKFIPAPLWSNKVIASTVALTTGMVSHLFDRPVILSARDSLRVQIALESVPAAPRLVSVSFTGTGLLSTRPYFFASDISVGDTNPHILNPTDFRNDGAEPIALTDMSLNCGSGVTDPGGIGDIRELRVQIRQLGNGTGADWYIGPTNPVLAQCPAMLLGQMQGRAVVHRFPGEGLIWEPGEGIIVQGLALDAAVEGFDLAVGLSGYISLT